MREDGGAGRGARRGERERWFPAQTLGCKKERFVDPRQDVVTRRNGVMGTLRNNTSDLHVTFM